MVSWWIYETDEKILHVSKPCYQPDALMRQYRVVSDALEYMEDLGWEPYQVLILSYRHARERI